MQGKSVLKRNDRDPVYVGIDTCKDWLDIDLQPHDQQLRVGNDREGLKRLKKALAGLDVALIA